MKCVEVIGLNKKNEEQFCPREATHKIPTPDGELGYCDSHFAQYRLNVEQNFNSVSQWAKDGVGW